MALSQDDIRSQQGMSRGEPRGAGGGGDAYGRDLGGHYKGPSIYGYDSDYSRMQGGCGVRGPWDQGGVRGPWDQGGCGGRGNR